MNGIANTLLLEKMKESLRKLLQSRETFAEEPTSGTITQKTLIVGTETKIPFHTHPEITELAAKIDKLTSDSKEIKKSVEAFPMRIRFVEAKEIPVDEAKEKISEYLKTHDIVYPDDIADELGLDLRVVMETVEKLIKEKKIEEAK